MEIMVPHFSASEPARILTEWIVLCLAVSALFVYYKEQILVFSFRDACFTSNFTLEQSVLYNNLNL